MKRGIGSPKPHRSRFSLFCKILRCRKMWFISAFPEIEKNISNSGPKAMTKMKKNWTFNEKVHRIRKTSQKPFFAFFARYYDAEKVIHERISWNWEDISILWPQIFAEKWWKIESFNEKVHRIRDNLMEPFFAFLQDITMQKNVIHKRIS